VIELRTLEDTPLETVHRTFVKAFSDYQVKMDLPLGRFENTLRRRGFSPALSVGAFAGDEMVGLVLIGVRQWRGRPTAYDAGTGVVPAHRKQGVTTGMFKEAVQNLRANGVEAYLLEVIKSNTPAVQLYRKAGFGISRSFTCYIRERSSLPPVMNAQVIIEDVEAGLLDWDALRAFWDFQPSWQNSPTSVMAVPESMAAVIARSGDEVVGYGVVERATGDVPQLAVAPDHREVGVGRAILGAIADRTEARNLAIINVEDEPFATHGFLRALGFDRLVDQFEMVQPLG
jgi:ribosomal protein S18 acetylase RimI-like enzyme